MAARIERAECETVLAFAARAQSRGRDVMIHEIGGASAVFAGPGQPINKLAGLGFAAIDEDALAAVERAYDARQAELRVELATLADPPVGILLTRRGYELAGYENVLGLSLTGGDLVSELARATQADAAGGVVVSRIEDSDKRVWIETVADGFSHPDEFDGPPPTESFDRDQIVDVFMGSSGAAGTALYLARRDGAIAGGGSIRISNALVQLSGASTLPAHRRRGVQSALLRARLLDAAAEGCDLAIVTTEPGSKSQANVQRAGFSLLYARAVLIRRPKA
jgi:GNAT superfamily N-acetyltransferase